MTAQGPRFPLPPSRALRRAGALVLVLCGFAAAGASAQQAVPGAGVPGAGVPRPAPVESAPLAPLPTPVVPAAPPAGSASPTQPPVAAPPIVQSPAMPAQPPAQVQSPAQSPAQGVPPAPPGTGGPAPAPVPVPASPPATSADARTTLIPVPGDTSNVDDVVLPEKPVIARGGTSTWDEGFGKLKADFEALAAAANAANLRIVGRPLALFIETDDLGFRYEAMLPVEGLAPGQAQLNADTRVARTPSGKALRFVHKSTYEEIDQTYEAITAYLDAKGVSVQDSFVEEYVTDLTRPDDDTLEVNIFVLPR